MTIPRPKWFSDEAVLVSTAATCGLTKGGRLLPIVDPVTGKRIQVQDPETLEMVDAVNDQLLIDAKALTQGHLTETLSFVPRSSVSMSAAVPVYYDARFKNQYDAALKTSLFKGFRSQSIGDLAKLECIIIKSGHGSPSQDQRIGDVPYIKVSDLRAGLVNINPTNRIPKSVAKKFWRGDDSGLQAFDLLCPERTSKNIGDFCVLLPGQEQVVTTKEVIVIRPGLKAEFDSFYLLWALTLKIVRDQWRRIIFMQTNREDVGKRYLEIEIPIAPNRATADKVSGAFREYYLGLAKARAELIIYLDSHPKHHFFVSGAEKADTDEQLSNTMAVTLPE